MRLAPKIGLSAALLAAIAAGAWRVLAPAPAPAVKAAAAIPVVVAEVQQRSVPIILDGLGTVQAQNMAVIRSQVTGLLQSVNFVEGQTVHRGDLLAQVDPRPYQARLVQAEAQLSRDQAHAANAQVNLDRNEPLLKRGFATDQQVTDEKSQVSQEQSAIKSDQAAVEDAHTQLSYTSLTAPFDGITGVRTLDVGNIIHPTDVQGLVTETQVQPISILFTIPAANIPQVQDALAAGPVQAAAFDQSGVRQLDAGRLLLINNQADPSSGTVQLKAEFPNLQRRLWPGTFVNVELTVRTVKDGLVIPTDAVQQGASGEFVFVVGEGSKVAPRPVTVAQRNRGSALVQTGLKAGDAVVVQGQYSLVDGTVVAPSNPDQVASNSAASSGLLP